ncbi:MAG: PcfJ domain-containing protein [Clostridia bacterium]|nr:PcfJ domain-containing protein [Clostridia bacterium]
MDKRALRKESIPKRKLDVRTGIFCAEQIEYVVCTAIKNIAHKRTLVLYVYEKKKVVDGDLTPRWTMFHIKEDYITLCREGDKTKWRTSMFQNLGPYWNFTDKCAFYSTAEEERVARFFKNTAYKGFRCLNAVQNAIVRKRTRLAEINNQKTIAARMKVVKALPRNIRNYMYMETLPHYVFYDYHKSKAPMKGYCTACKKEVGVVGKKNNEKGFCPNCKRYVTFKSRGRRGHFHDRSTAQVIQRTGENEIVVRFIKAYCNYYKCDVPAFSVYETARLFIRWKDNKIVKWDRFYYSYSHDTLTPWCRGDRPRFNRWCYYFENDLCGFLYQRNLDKELRDTPWKYCALNEYYNLDPTPLYIPDYLRTYLSYPILEYLVKLKFTRLATYIVYGDSSGHHFTDWEHLINTNGKNITEVLGVEKKHIQFLRQVDPGIKQFKMIKAMLNDGIVPDTELMKWCSQKDVEQSEHITIPLRFMTPYKLMKYANDQFTTHRRKTYGDGGYYRLSDVLSDYKDYLCMSEALGHDMKSSFVLYPNNLKEAHDRVNELTKAETTKAYDRKIAKMFNGLQSRYGYNKMGFMVLPPATSKDISREGDKLHHCVGRYIPSVVKEECIILFIRKASAPKKPYCTVEIRNGNIVQARIQNNDPPTPKLQRFIDLWKQQVIYAPQQLAA